MGFNYGLQSANQTWRYLSDLGASTVIEKDLQIASVAHPTVRELHYKESEVRRLTVLQTNGPSNLV